MTVVVSGVPVQVTVNGHQKVEQLIRESFKEARQPKTDPSGWSLRFESGGAPIAVGSRVADAGIVAGVTLFLDPDEGGGGNASAPAGPEEPPLLVDPEVTRAKLSRQVENWQQNEEIYRRRGWVLLHRDDLTVYVAFFCRLPIGPPGDVVAAPIAARLAFHNYDVWPPSVHFIDPLTRAPLPHPLPIVGQDFRTDGGEPSPLGPQRVILDQHPMTGRPFLCKRGAREYHSHNEHDGDDWLLYRSQGLGTLAQICTMLWRATTRTVTGVTLTAQRIPVDDAAVNAMAFELQQQDVDALAEQLRPQVEAARAALPGGIAPG